MSPSKKSRANAELTDRCTAEDRAFEHLEKFPPEVAFATALAAEIMLAEQWASEQNAMLQRGDNSVVFRIADHDFQIMAQARDMVPPGGKAHIEGLHLLLRHFDSLPLDQRWKVASAVAFRTAVRALVPDGFLSEETPSILKP